MTTQTAVTQNSETSEIATFYLGEMLVGINIRQIQEINRHVQTTAIPHAPPIIRGVINLRGDMVTVIDLPLLLGMESCEITPKTRVVVIDSDKEQTGLLVDRISDVVRVQQGGADSVPPNLNGLEHQCFQGVIRLDEELLTVLDIDKILNFDSESH